MGACDRCLRRAWLVGRLAPYIARSIAEHRGVPALLGLGDGELIAAVCGRDRPRVEGEHRRLGAARLRREAAEAGLGVVCRHDGRLPERLLEAPDAPALLYVRGDERRLKRLAGEDAVVVVGARRASAYGLEVAHGLGRELATCGVPVVSGMALGADSAAHEGALTLGGLTVSVLAGGADLPYPRSKDALYRRIAAEGLVLSEMPPGLRPHRWCFPARNRIMAALGSMTVVVEGAESSGSLITAAFAAELGRDVGAVPGQVTSPLARGPNALIADGACLVRSAADVLDALCGSEWGDREPAPQVPVGLEPRLQALLEAVERGQGSVDSIACRAGDAGGVLSGLGELELIGLIRRDGAGRYVRCAGGAS